MSTFHGLSASIVLACICFASGCTTTTYNLRVAGSGVVTPSSGPTAIGPLGASRRVSFEGGVSENFVPGASGAAAAGAGEASAIHTVGRGRASYTIADRVELGLSMQVSHSRWSTVSSRGAVPVGVEDTTLWGGGFQARGMVLGDASGGLGLLAEVGLHQASYGQRAVLDVVRRTDTLDGDFVNASRETWDVVSSTVLVVPQTGLFGVFSPTSRLRLTAGGAIGARYTVRTTYSAQTTCEPGDGAGCERRARELPSPFEAAPQLTGFVSAGYALGPVTLLGQVAVNAFGESPVSGTLGVRVTP